MNNEFITLSFLLKKIRNLVKDNYPLKINYKTNIPKLSHLHLNPINSKYILNENISVNGYVNNNKIKFINTKTLKLSWKKLYKLNYETQKPKKYLTYKDSKNRKYVVFVNEPTKSYSYDKRAR